MKQKTLENNIEKIKAKLVALGDMHPGSLSKQYNICGKKVCRCKDPATPKKHGPYYQLSFVSNGKSTSRFIKSEHVAEVKKQITTYKKFKMLIQDWSNLATQIAQMKIKLARGLK